MDPSHVFSGVTAAMLHRIPVPRRLEGDERVHVTALDGGRAPRGRGVRGYTTSAGPRRVLVSGLPALSPEDTWCSLAALLDLDELIAAGDRLLGLPRPLTDVEGIDAAISRHRSRAGAAVLRQARPELRAQVFSPRETVTRLRLVRAGLPEPEPNSPIVLASGRRTKGDLVYAAYRILVEYDGEQHLLDAAQWATDVARLNDLAMDGWCVIRITKHTPAATVVALARRALEDRGWTP